MNITDSSFQIKTGNSLPANEVQLWRIDLEALGHDESRWQPSLSSDEVLRASRFHFQHDRQHFVASRALLRTILGSYLSLDPSDVTFSYSNREKPSLGPAHAGTGVRFNVSHSGGIALFAFACHRDIGVDVEQIRHDSDLDSIARRFFSSREQDQLATFASDTRAEAFFRCWTRKEAYIKATGDGLSLPLSQFDVSLASEASDALLATRPDAAEARRWRLREVPAGSGYLAALCVHGHDWKLNDWLGSAKP